MLRNYQPELLFRQILLIPAIAGIIAARHFWPGIMVLLLLIMHQHHRFIPAGRSARPLLTAILMLASFLAGMSYMQVRAPVRPELPLWAVQASAPSLYQQELWQTQKQFFKRAGDNSARAANMPDWWNVADNALSGPDSSVSDIFKNGLRVSAVVNETQGMADRNLRLVLEDVRPVYPNAHLPEAILPLPDNLAFTWNNSLAPEGEKAPPPGVTRYGSARPDKSAKLTRRPVKGDKIELQLRLREQRSLQNPGLWETESYWADRRVWTRGWALGSKAELTIVNGSGQSRPSIWREQLRLDVLRNLPHSGGLLATGAEFIPALLFGDKYLLDSRDTELISRSTLSHSLALSGLHLGYAAALGYFAIFLLYRLRPNLALRLPRQKASVLGGLVPALLYLWLGGAPLSLLRSFLMLLFFGLLLYLNHPHLLIDALLWALGIILLLNPSAMFDLRLQLSALSIAAIILAVPFIKSVNAALFGRIMAGPRNFRARVLIVRAGRYLLSLLLLSLIIQIALAPLLARSFGLLGLAMPLNLLWLPVLGAVVMPCSFLGLAASALGLDVLASGLFYLATLPCGWLVHLLGALDAGGFLQAVYPPRPHWLTMLGYWFLLSLLPLIFALVRQKIQRRAHAAPLSNAPKSPRLRPVTIKCICGFLLFILPLLWPVWNKEGVRLRLLDVGHGQAVLLEWPEGRLLLDGGGGNSPRFDIGKEVIAATLADNRLPQIDYMLASHLDMDHAQGLVFPLRHMGIGYYADNGQEADKNFAQNIPELLESLGLERHKLSAGDRLALDQAERAEPGNGLSLEFLYPPAGVTESGNNTSLVARLVWRGQGLALLCGDVEKSGQREILRSLPNKDTLRARLLVLPHHGSANALLPDFYDAVKPDLALASCAYGNSWNFPSPKVMEALRERSIPLLSTARSGQIAVEWDANFMMQVLTARSGVVKKPD